MKKKCPNCGSSRIAKIVYGKPLREFVEEPLRRGEVVLGGKKPKGDAPTEQCLACGHRFGTLGEDGVES